ncbi:unnamed protein product [Cylicostephanus goldi]|uniref:Uncharacterized protein n=1 Tax=Cylicostephanus goldi TaxID=71465 RepID=A0A3P7MLY2_CYLGO|nr:unnamed protein product [Cylicostephanus goldi]
MTYVPQNVLITGGCGFIGSNFVNHIHDAWPHCNFVNVDKLILNSDTQHVNEKASYSYPLPTKYEKSDCTSTRCYNETIEAIDNNVIAFIELLQAVKDYGKVKRFIAGEAYVRAFTSQYKLPIITARMNNIYGPNQWDVKVLLLLLS